MKKSLTLFALIFFTTLAFSQATQEKIYGSIKEALADPPNVRHLMVFGEKELTISILPDEILKFENLEEIDLWYLPELNFNQSMQLLAKLPHLKYIIVSSCNVISDGSVIPGFTCLEELFLSGTDIKELPKELSSIKTLKKIILSDPGINLSTTFHILAQLPVLKSLEIANSKLTLIPSEIAELKNVEELDFLGNKLTELPKELWGLSQLKKLSLASNQIKKIDLTTGDLPNLIDLNLSSNDLTRFPVQPGMCINLRKLNLFGNDIETVELTGNLPNLISIDLSLNNITEFPVQLARCPNLKKLRLWVNHIKTVDLKKGDLPNLLSINLSENEFTKFPLSPVLFPKLTWIAIAQNAIEVLPKEIGEFKMLDSLDLHDNKLMRLPPQIGQLKALIFLNVMTNKLTTTGISPIYQNKNLMSLWLDENSIDAMPAKITNLVKLKKFSISDNPITDLPDGFANLTDMNLIRLSNLKGMNWEHTFTVLGKLPRLQELEATEMDITKMPAGFESLTHATIIYLAYNNFDKDEQARIKSLVPNAKIDFGRIP